MSARTTTTAVAALVLPLVALACAPAASAATGRSFTCTGIISRDYTRQTVTGTLTGVKPTNVTVINYLGATMVTAAAPARHNAWWAGYWKSTYAMNQWRVGKDASATSYHLMLPDTRPGAAFDGLLVSEFDGGASGNWQNWMTCTAS